MKIAYSLWTAAMGWTAWAARIVSGDASLGPTYRTLPCCTSPASAPTVSSIGVFCGSMRCWQSAL